MSMCLTFFGVMNHVNWLQNRSDLNAWISWFSVSYFSEPSTYIAEITSSNPVNSRQQHAAGSSLQSPHPNQTPEMSSQVQHWSHFPSNSAYRFQVPHLQEQAHSKYRMWWLFLNCLVSDNDVFCFSYSVLD